MHATSSTTTHDPGRELLTSGRVTLNVPASLVAEFRAMAERADRSYSRELRRALVEYVERHRADA
jgi:predicted transcriptional regulator